MSAREKTIASSIVHAFQSPSQHRAIAQRIPKYFSAHWLDFVRVQQEIFQSLRELWHITEEDYNSSFATKDNDIHALRAQGDMGFSGSTFYATNDSTYLIKSVPRHFEYSFFKDDLLEPYAEHMKTNLASLLVRITDFLENAQSTIGTTLGMAPSHHIVMENIMYGQEEEDAKDKQPEWESYDLKPMTYFYPERDVANGAFATEDALSKLADEFKDNLVLSLDIAEDFKAQLQKDTALLARCNAVDYSLFLVCIPVELVNQDKSSSQEDIPVPPAEPPFAPPEPPSWRTGIKSADGKWLYRAAILDFFWAKHKPTPRVMTGLINTYNVLDKQGPMSITTNATEYRQRFLQMCNEMIEVKNDE